MTPSLKKQTLGKVYFFGQKLELEFCFYKMALVNRICQRSLMALPFRKFLQGTTRLPLVSQEFCRFKKTTSVEFPETKTKTPAKQWPFVTNSVMPYTSDYLKISEIIEYFKKP